MKTIVVLDADKGDSALGVVKYDETKISKNDMVKYATQFIMDKPGEWNVEYIFDNLKRIDGIEEIIPTEEKLFL